MSAFRSTSAGVSPLSHARTVRTAASARFISGSAGPIIDIPVARHTLLLLRSLLGNPIKIGPARISRTPLSVFLLVLILVYMIEAAVMVLLMAFPGLKSTPAALVIIDSSLLVCALAPALWFVVVRPLRKMATARGQLLRSQTMIQEAERARVSQELHDEMGQVQTAILLTAKAGSTAPTLEAAREHAQTIHGLATIAIESTRRLARGLSPAVLMDFGLTVAITRLAEDFSAGHDFHVEVQSSLGDQRLVAEVELAAYRVVQESLVNAAKHAGASRARIDLGVSGRELVFSMTDNGRGFDVPIQSDSPLHGMGLRGMHERLVLLGGRLDIRSRRGEGTTVIGRLPIEKRTT